MDGKLKDLIESWDALLGDALLADQGVVRGDDLWLLELASVVESAFVDDPSGAKSGDAMAALESLDLLSPSALGAIQPGAADAELIRAVLVRQGLSERAASVAVAAMSTLAGHWLQHQSTLRSAVRAALAGAAQTMERRFPVDELQQIGFAAAPDSARRWAAWLVGAPDWGRGSVEFASKLDTGLAELAEIADALDRSIERIDLVLSVGMDVWCRGCDPTERPECVDEAAEIGVAVICPLLARVSGS